MTNGKRFWKGHFPGGTEEDHEIPDSGYANSLPRIEQEHLPNTIPVHYFYTNLLGDY
jgi:hypothetical protein